LRFEHKLRIVYCKGGELSPAAQTFLRVVESVAKTRKCHYTYAVERTLRDRTKLGNRPN
jgi:hypothetical protein